jgi:hypothetical protein
LRSRFCLGTVVLYPLKWITCIEVGWEKMLKIIHEPKGEVPCVVVGGGVEGTTKKIASWGASYFVLIPTSRGMSWMGHVALMGLMGNQYGILIETSKRTRRFGRSGHR